MKTLVSKTSADAGMLDIANVNGLLARLTARLVRTFDAIAARRSRKLAAEQLGRLDDRMLADIGISRSEIQSVLLDKSGERRRMSEVRF